MDPKNPRRSEDREPSDMSAEARNEALRAAQKMLPPEALAALSGGVALLAGANNLMEKAAEFSAMRKTAPRLLDAITPEVALAAASECLTIVAVTSMERAGVPADAIAYAVKTARDSYAPDLQGSADKLAAARIRAGIDKPAVEPEVAAAMIARRNGTAQPDA